VSLSEGSSKINRRINM